MGMVGGPLEITVREYRPGDEAAILAAFNRAFAAVDPHFQPRSPAVWEWQYRRNPAGAYVWIAVDAEGEVVAQMAGIPIRMVQDGQEVRWNQVADTFVDPRHARSLRNLYYAVAKPYADRYSGAPPERDPVGYGMPVRRALRIGGRQLGYEVVRSQNKLCAAPADVRQERAGAVALEEVASFPESIVAVQRRVEAAPCAVAVRDRAFLDWRFVQHPQLVYRRAVASRAGEPLGLAVYRAGHFDGSEDGLVCDWSVAPGEREAAAALRAWLVACARADGAERLTVMLPETCADWTDFQRAGFRALPTGYYACAHSYHGPYDMRWLYHHWRYTLADFDLC